VIKTLLVMDSEIIQIVLKNKVVLQKNQGIMPPSFKTI